MNRYFSYFFLLLLVSGWLGACSAERHNPLARVYQNTTARYNAFFLGNERLKTLEADVAAKTLPDYNRLLPIFVPIDSTAAAGMRKELDEIIKKASYPIQKHPNSDWTDDSYLLIGKARFYGREFEDAIKTFRYINSTSQKEETRHEALVWLMRSFVTVEDLESARAVSDVMKKQFLNQENATLLFLTRAQYHLLRKETPLAIENLKLALPLIEKKDEEARIRFILAQLYQQTNQDKLAYREYSRILRKNPPYDLGFQSKLHLGQVTELSNTADLEKIDKYFRKLEKDVKNKEFLDKIHYERALFELKQDKPDLALQQLQQSVRLSTSNPSQKGYSYLLAGQIYYDKKQQYRLAHAYYDSAVQVLPPSAGEYAAAVERRDVLSAFAGNLGVVEREDSLLALAQLPKADLDKRIEEIITQAAERQAAEAEKAAALAKQPAPANLPGGMGNTSIGNTNPGSTGNTGSSGPGNSGSQSSGGLWYFDNPVTIASARSEFARRWGNRRLQDNWRTSNQQGADPQQDLVAGNTPAAPAGPAGETPDQQQALRAKLLQDIPLSAEQKKASLGRLEEAYFNLAGIYRLQLKEPARAIETYEKLLARFPQTSHAAEVYYTLYLMYHEANDAKQNQYATLLKQKFPGSRYARLIDDPDYLARMSAGNKEVANLFDEAFSLYEKQQYPAASQVISRIRQQYPDSDLNDKVSFLAVRIVGQTEQPVLFKMALQDFVKRYPNSPLTVKAREYLDALALYEQGKLSEAEFDKAHPPKAVPASPAPDAPAPAASQQRPAGKAANTTPPATRQQTAAAPPTQSQPPVSGTAQAQNTPPAGQPAPSQPASNPAAQTLPQAQTQPQAQPPVTPAPGTGQQPAPATPATEAAAKPRFADVVAASPQLVVIAYPKGHAAFTGVAEKVQGYNSKYNAADKLSVQTAPLNPGQDLVIVGTFANAQKARIYVSKQKTPQSPLSKIRGIEFATFVVSPENLPLLLQGGKLEEYLTFYKNNY